MIRLYCEDIGKRSEIRSFYRDAGLSVDAPPCAEFIDAANRSDTTAVIVAGAHPAWLGACLRHGTLTIRVGGASGDFSDYDDAELVRLLRSREGDVRLFAYGECLDSTADGVYYLGYPLRLTPTELAILAYLVRCAPEGASEAQLMSACVGDAHRKSSILRQHVSMINKKARTIYGGRALITSDRRRDGVKTYYVATNI